MPTDVSSLSYEEARERLVAVVRELEAGSATLEWSLDLWEEGNALAARCGEWLAGAQARIDAVVAGNDRAVGAAGVADAAGEASGDMTVNEGH